MSVTDDKKPATARARVIKADTGRPIHELVRVQKGEIPTSQPEESKVGTFESELLFPPYPMTELKKLIDISSILQQCVDAYARNIVGFGISPQYTEDDVTQGAETPEMKAEWTLVKRVFRFFNFDQSFEDLFGQLIKDREITGNAFAELLRNGKGLIDGGERIDPTTMRVGRLSDPIRVETIRDGETFIRFKRFRKFCQIVGSKRTWFKEIGDPRTMNRESGDYTTETLTDTQAANEVLHLKIGADPYGIPRWIGQLIHMYGARLAEELNYRYFLQGRHVPLAILLSNAKLSPESEQELMNYAASVEGVENSHKFLLIEAESNSDGLLDDKIPQTKVELKPLAEILQKDALFLEYDDASREKVQSSFRLPDLYVGRSKDFNRATADAARETTEEQVFEPERNSLEFEVNEKILIGYELKFTKAVFDKPEISNADDMSKILTVLIAGKALSPNDLRDLAGKYLGKDLEPFDGDQYNLPIGVPDPNAQPAGPPGLGGKVPFLKSSEQADVVGLLKDVRDVLEELRDREEDRDII